MAYKKGESGNRAGRPKGIPDRRNALIPLLDSQAPQLLARLIELAMTGDVQALKICIDRLIPIPKNKYASTGIELPTTTINEKNLAKIKKDILSSVLAGSLSADEGDKIIKMIDANYGKRAPTTTINFSGMTAIDASRLYMQIMKG